MRVQLNLATRPFGRSRLFWFLSTVAGAVLISTAVWMIAIWAMNRETPEDLAAREEQLTRQFQQLAAEEAELRGMLGTPDTIDVYDRSHFLNQLLVRKSVSWTKTFRDVETVLPPRVLMMQIRPAVTDESEVELEMQVGAESPADFIELLQALENSEVFGPPEVRGFNPPNDNTPYYRYVLSARYEQKL